MSLAAEAEPGALYIKFQRSHPITTCTQINGIQTTSHDNANLQHNGARRSQKQYHVKTEIGGHEIHWLRYKKNQINFCHLWAPGKKRGIT